MTGSVALDVVIGLVFVYLLYSLLATVLCEIVATRFGLRARNLRVAIARMLEDTAETNEGVVKAAIRAAKLAFVVNEGPATCVFYHLPVIKYLGRNSLYSKPSYISASNFSKALFEMFRRYGGSNDTPDLERVQNVLRASITYTGILKVVKDEILQRTSEEPELNKVIHYGYLRKRLKVRLRQWYRIQNIQSTQLVLITKIGGVIYEKKVGKQALKLLSFFGKRTYTNLTSFLRKNQKLKMMPVGKAAGIDPAQRRILWKIENAIYSRRADKEAVFMVDQLLNLFGSETRSHLESLLHEAQNDLFKFRILIEQWFDDTMERSIGWYKQKVQFLLLLIGLGLALAFNANTFKIVGKLSVDEDARDKLVSMANTYVSEPQNIQGINPQVNAALDSLRKARLDSLEKIRKELQTDVREANAILGQGWNIPDSLSFYAIQKLDSLKQAHVKKAVPLNTSVIRLKRKYLKDSLVALVYPSELGHVYSKLLTDSCDNLRFEGYHLGTHKIKADNSFLWGYFHYTKDTLFSGAFWGYLVTGLAISLGSPFWFDMLNKLVQIRGAVRVPTNTQAGGATASAQSPADPSNVLNRKG